jgi:glycosyltransferase involved in cell wall biosynthesis
MVAVASEAVAVICGSRFVRDWAAQYNENTHIVWTGTPPTQQPPVPHASRRRIVTWAQSAPSQYKSDFDFIVGILVKVSIRVGASFTFRLYGCDPVDVEPNLDPLKRVGVTIEHVPYLPYDLFLSSLREVAVGLSSLSDVSPFNQGKSFGKILAYLDACVPIVCSDKADHSLLFDEKSAVVSNDPDRWVAAISDLLDDPEQRDQMSAAAYHLFQRELSTDAAAKKVAKVFEDVL